MNYMWWCHYYWDLKVIYHLIPEIESLLDINVSICACVFVPILDNVVWSIWGIFAIGTSELLFNGHKPEAEIFDDINVSICACVFVPILFKLVCEYKLLSHDPDVEL